MSNVYGIKDLNDEDWRVAIAFDLGGVEERWDASLMPSSQRKRQTFVLNGKDVTSTITKIILARAHDDLEKRLNEAEANRAPGHVEISVSSVVSQLGVEIRKTRYYPQTLWDYAKAWVNHIRELF